MTEPDKQEPTPGPQSAGVTEAAAVATEPAQPEPAADQPPTPEGQEAEAPAPPPEPWTPERVRSWNAYYDGYVALAALLLVFVAAANKIFDPSLWTYLQAGHVTAQTGRPVTTDPFSYTMAGQRWVNIPWLFEWSHSELHRLALRTFSPAEVVSKLDPVDVDRPVKLARADQIAAGTLVGLNALVRLLTGLALLGIRRPGPGLWWVAICVVLALGAGPVLGPVAGLASVNPETWGLFFLAVELYLLHRAFALGRRGGLVALVPLFLLWANVDESFAFGWVVLATTVLGTLQPRLPAGSRPKAVPEPLSAGADGPPTEPEAPAPPSLSRGLIVLAVCALVCLANPSFHHAVRVAVAPLFDWIAPAKDAPFTRERAFSFFPVMGRAAARHSLGNAATRFFVADYLIVVGVGLASFLLNRQRFSLGRFLTFAVAAVLWGGRFYYFRGGFGLVFAVTLALNGQEWYQDVFGVEGRLGRRWALWSTGGRLATLVVLFACVAKALTGYGALPEDPRFGFGYNPDDFAFEAADFLRDAPLQGHVLNLSESLGDALIWRAYPHRKTFIDNREHLFPPTLKTQLLELEQALAGDEAADWKPVLDKYGISAVLFSMRETYTRDTSQEKALYSWLMGRPEQWIPFYDDGNVVMFGRADAPAGDVAFFKAKRLDPEALAYRRQVEDDKIPTFNRPPIEVSWIDQILRNRTRSRMQPHVRAAWRWLNPAVDTGGAELSGYLPDPAHCLLAIREARTALAQKPDDSTAYQVLNLAYRYLLIQEWALMAGIPLTPENTPRIAQLSPRPGLLASEVNPGALPTRFQQWLTVLNDALRTLPPRETAADPALAEEERKVRMGLNEELANLYIAAGYLDLARDRLQAVYDLIKPGDVAPESLTNLRTQLAELNDRIGRLETRMNEQVTGPTERFQLALRDGAIGMAIHELQDAEQTGVNAAQVRPLLIDLYCQIGQPDQALDLLANESEEAAPELVPGNDYNRRALVQRLLGDDRTAAFVWERDAIPQVQIARTLQGVHAGIDLTRGDPGGSVRTFLSLPDRIATQATWEANVGLAALELGQPARAADHFTRALELAPDLALRPVLAYYLEKIGKPVPDLPDESR